MLLLKCFALVALATAASGSSTHHFGQSRFFVTSSDPEGVPNREFDQSVTRQAVVSIQRGGWGRIHRGGGGLNSSQVVSKKAAIIMGLVLAFNAGFVNGCCLSGLVTADSTKPSVAAVTASFTNSALGMARGDMDQFQFFFKVILSFMSGSTIAALTNPRPVPFSISSSTYDWSFAIGAILLCTAGSLLGREHTVRLGVYFATMANGIQNSVTSTMTDKLCRTSHFSGVTSDIGTFLGQCLRGNAENAFKLKVFTGLAFSFWLGGFMSFGLAKRFSNTSLFIAAGVFVFMGVLYDRIWKRVLQQTRVESGINSTSEIDDKE